MTTNVTNVEVTPEYPFTLSEAHAMLNFLASRLVVKVPASHAVALYDEESYDNSLYEVLEKSFSTIGDTQQLATSLWGVDYSRDGNEEYDCYQLEGLLERLLRPHVRSKVVSFL